MDDLVLNVRQVYQYPLQTTAGPGDVVLLQQSGPQNNSAGPYGSMNILDIVTQARKTGGSISLASTDFISWGAPTISFDGTSLNITGVPVTVTQLNAGTISSAGDVFANGVALANQDWVTALFDSVVQSSVWSVNGRKGDVVLQQSDILQAGAAPINSPRFSGIVLAPSPWDLLQNDERVATCAWVQRVVHCALWGFDTNDINRIFANSPPGVFPRSITPPLGDASTRIATTAFVDESVEFSQDVILLMVGQGYAPLASPQFTGVPTAPTAAAGNNTAQLATTAFVQTAIVGSTVGVASFNTRTGAVVLEEADIVAANGATLDSPNFTGTPMAPTPPTGTDTNQLATCAWVLNEVSAISSGVTSFNGRSGAITLVIGDITGAGGAPISSPAFTNTPTAPTAAQTVNNTQIATTAYVRAALAAAPGGVSSWNGRTGSVSLQANDLSAVGGALLASPAFTGTPTAPTVTGTDNSTSIATTAWVVARLAAVGVVSTWNGRAGAVTMTATDIVNASGAIFRQGDTAPAATPNTLWYNSLNGQLYVQYTDPVSSAQNWVVANSQVQPAPAVGSRVLLMSKIVNLGTPVASVDFLYNFDNTYDIYAFECYNLMTDTSGSTLGMRFSWDGSTFDATTNHAAYWVNIGAVGTLAGAGTSAVTYMGLLAAMSTANAAYAGINHVDVRLPMPWTTDRVKGFNFITHYVSTSQFSTLQGGGANIVTVLPLKGVRFLMQASGNITRGVFNLYGIVKAAPGAN